MRKILFSFLSVYSSGLDFDILEPGPTQPQLQPRLAPRDWQGFQINAKNKVF